MIVRVDPEDWSEANTVQLDSDAADNITALREMEDWAAEHGLVRTNEYWLRRAIIGGKRVFRGICFRMTADEKAAALEETREVERRMSHLPVSRHTA